MRNLLLSLSCVLLVASMAAAATYHVGADRDVKKVGDVLGKLQPGDVVEVDPGVYREAMRIKVNGTKDAPITIRGVAGKPRPAFDAEGLNVSGEKSAPRAVFQIEAAYIVLEHLEIRNARNGNTAAGVRLNGSTNAIIRDCYSHDNDLGVFGNDNETATIDRCEVAFNSTKEWNGYAHNFYMHGNRVVVRNSYIHDCPFGQNFKTRAHYNELWYNWIVDSNEGEVGPVDEHGRQKVNTGLADSNTLLVGNVIVSKPGRTGNDSKFILLGSELKDGAGHNGTLYLFNNTLVAGTEKIIFIQLADPKAKLVASNNIFYGSDKIFGTPKAAAGVSGANNLVPANAKAPAEFAGTIKGDPKFVAPADRDFRLSKDSPAVDAGVADMEYVDGDGKTHAVKLELNPWPGLNGVERKLVGKDDLGAYELGAKRVTTRPE
ncbi:MAG: right-handed parallel beta-helix repeat-containing protein [Phycisphaerae bacterium]|nr:right-handed parallel beta-helix repeat-containing protein [Phycisphaerae bacterium]